MKENFDYVRCGCYGYYVNKGFGDLMFIVCFTALHQCDDTEAILMQRSIRVSNSGYDKLAFRVQVNFTCTRMFFDKTINREAVQL